MIRKTPVRLITIRKVCLFVCSKKSGSNMILNLQISNGLATIADTFECNKDISLKDDSCHQGFHHKDEAHYVKDQVNNIGCNMNGFEMFLNTILFYAGPFSNWAN